MFRSTAGHQVSIKKQPTEAHSEQSPHTGPATAFHGSSSNLGLCQKENFMGLSHSAGTYLAYLCLYFTAFPPNYLRAASRKEREGLLQINATSCGFLILHIWNLLFISYLQPLFSKSRSPTIYFLSLLTSNWIKKNVPILFSSEVCTSH